MRQVLPFFCALHLLSVSLLATPAEDFTARAEALIANKEARNDSDRLHRLFEFSWEYTMKESPEFATSIGYPGQNDRWTDISFEAIERRKATDKLDLEAIKSIDRAKLEEGDAISYDLYRRNAEFSVEGQQFPFELLQVNQMGGVQQNVAQVISATTFKTTKDYEDLVARLNAIPALIEQTTALLQKGVEQKFTPPQITLRAVRLVVDTGLHSMDWKREEAIKYFEENTGNPPHDIEVEVDRYIVWPSQALGYKIGQLKIRELRTYAEKELGQKMDLRAFHDELLKNGALPMSVLETHMKQWVAKRKSA